jgi:hypothetical protein
MIHNILPVFVDQLLVSGMPMKAGHEHSNSAVQQSGFFA